MKRQLLRVNFVGTIASVCLLGGKQKHTFKSYLKFPIDSVLLSYCKPLLDRRILIIGILDKYMELYYNCIIVSLGLCESVISVSKHPNIFVSKKVKTCLPTNFSDAHIFL